MPQIGERCYAVMRDLVDVESKLGLDVLALSLGVVHRRTVFCAQFREFNRNGKVGCFRMPDGVTNVVGERANGKGKFIGVARIAEQVDDEVA
jgi:hypothetical protein